MVGAKQSDQWRNNKAANTICDPGARSDQAKEPFGLAHIKETTSQWPDCQIHQNDLRLKPGGKEQGRPICRRGNQAQPEKKTANDQESDVADQQRVERDTPTQS
ncbi:MAG TPA: hypothetical protein VFX76_08320 [Roseiflexaceae bacterium]|nr:hypothetical protein [Roseiflexaceae bacterium]